LPGRFLADFQRLCLGGVLRCQQDEKKTAILTMLRASAILRRSSPECILPVNDRRLSGQVA
jgi:hypothetical protein